MTTKAVILLVGGGIESVPGLTTAKRMGLDVVVSDANPACPAALLADGFLQASTYDVEETVARALRYHQQVRPIDGVFCLGSDIPLTVASVAQALNLPGIPIQAATVVADKLLMKDCFQAAGIPLPWYAPVVSAGALEEIVATQKRTLVVKPPDSRGARGVIRLLPGMDSAAVYAESAAQSPTGRVMVEQYLSGPQLSTESRVVDGQVHTIGLSDRNYEYLDRFAPYFIENGGDLPSCLGEQCIEKTRRLLERVAPALGIINGVIKGDIVIVDGEPYIIEVAARLSGGYFCSHEIPLNTGVDFVGVAVDLALGRTIDPVRLVSRFNQGVSQRYLFAAPGTVVAIEGVEEAGNIEGVVHVELRVAVGEKIGAVKNHPSRGGVIIAIGDNRQQAIERVERAVSCIHIHTRETHQP